MSDIYFEEDKEILNKMDPRDVVPEKGLEGWFHKHSPYGAKTNRIILILIAVAIFVISSFFFLATVYNQNQISGERTNTFIERSNTTNSR